MSGYNYSEGGCKTCLQKGSYLPLSETTNYTCDQQCLCRHSQERTAFDKTYYSVYQSDKPVNIQNMIKMVNKGGVDCSKEGWRR